MIPRVSWVWVLPPLATSLVALAHPIIDPWHDGVAGLAPLVARNDVWLAVHVALLALFPLSALALVQAVAGIESTGARVARLMLAVKALFDSPITGALFLLGTAAWTLGAGAVAVTLWRASAPLAPVALIAIAAPLLFLDHPAPFGPVTFAAVAAALAWLAWSGPAKD